MVELAGLALLTISPIVVAGAIAETVIEKRKKKDRKFIGRNVYTAPYWTENQQVIQRRRTGIV